MFSRKNAVTMTFAQLAQTIEEQEKAEALRIEREAEETTRRQDEERWYNESGLREQYVKKYLPLSAIGSWERVYPSSVAEETTSDVVKSLGLSDFFAYHKGCSHSYRLRKGTVIEKRVAGGEPYCGRCLVCAKMAILPVETREIFEWCVDTVGINDGYDNATVIYESEMVAAFRAAYTHLYYEKNLLTKYEWSALDKRTTSRKQIVDERNKRKGLGGGSARYTFKLESFMWPN